MWYYTNNGQQQGPVDDATLDQLIAQGIATSDTLLWKEGFAEWTPLRQARAGTASLTAAAAASTCSMCGQAVGADNLIDLLGHRVCAACKPLAVQMFKEGATPVGSGTAWSEGKRVVTRDKAELPSRCYKCNEPATGPALKRKVYWHHPAFFVLIFAGLLIYVIAAMIVRKNGVVDIHLCDRHQRLRRNFIAGAWSAFGLSILIFVIGCAEHQGIVITLGFFVFLASIIIGIIGVPVARPARIKDGTIWLNGSGQKFRESLPPWIA